MIAYNPDGSLAGRRSPPAASPTSEPRTATLTRCCGTAQSGSESGRTTRFAKPHHMPADDGRTGYKRVKRARACARRADPGADLKPKKSLLPGTFDSRWGYCWRGTALRDLA